MALAGILILRHHMSRCLQSKDPQIYADALKYLNQHHDLKYIVEAQALLKEILDILNNVKTTVKTLPPSFALIDKTLNENRHLVANPRTMEFTNATETLHSLIREAKKTDTIIPNPIKSITEKLKKRNDYEKIGQNLNSVIRNIGKWDAGTILDNLSTIKASLTHSATIVSTRSTEKKSHSPEPLTHSGHHRNSQ